MQVAYRCQAKLLRFRHSDLRLLPRSRAGNERLGPLVCGPFKHKLSKIHTLWHPFCLVQRRGPFMVSLPLSRTHLSLRSRAFYRRVLAQLTQAKAPFLVGGAFALEHYTGIWRYTKDLDIFMRRRHIRPVLKLLGRAGFHVELTFPHWLAKVYERN